MKRFNTSIFVGLLLSMLACGEDADESVDSSTIEIAGTYSGPFPNEDGDDTEIITSASWTNPYGSFEVVEFSNAENWAIGQNPPDAAFYADLFSRLVWTEPSEGVFYYCTLDFGLQSVEAAKASTMSADASDPETMGCGEAPWTKLTPK